MESTTDKVGRSPRSTKVSTATVPTREAVELRAYELYLQRGGNGGGELDDWLAAERELAVVKTAGKSPMA